MSLRETLNKNPMIVVGVAAVLIAAAAYVGYSNASGPPQAGGAVHFSDDDGQTYFAGKLNDPSPMDRNGKKAYRAFVFRCGADKPFVGYLERLPEEIIALVQKAKRDPSSITGAEKGKLMTASQMRQVKKPGEAKWVPAGPTGMRINCPDGSPAQIVD